MKVWINADDYGWNEGCSQAIFDAFQRGWLTTTTACVNGSFFEDAAKMISPSIYRDRVGLHLNITEGLPITEMIKKCPRVCKDGVFYGFPSRQIPLNKKWMDMIYKELSAQAVEYKKTGLHMDHIDSHHFIHNSISVFPLCLKVAKDVGCHKIRRFRNVGAISPLKRVMKGRYNRVLDKHGFIYSDYFGSAEDYMSFSRKGQNVVFEIMVHPDYSHDGVLIDRENADYSNPMGKPLEGLIEEVKRRGDTIL